MTINENDPFTQKVTLTMLRFIAVAFLAVSVTLLIQRDNLKQQNDQFKMRLGIAESGLKICSHLLVEKDKEIHDATGCQ